MEETRETSGCESGLNPERFQDEWLGSSASLRKLIERLASDGQVAPFLELPTICVLGDTSSGKSSLLSSLCTIELPTSHKMTTRCPTRIHIRRATEQIARVNIQWRSDVSLPGYPEQCITADEWDEIPTAIVQAQEFILNQTNKDVSPDIVTLHVQGPQFSTDLTLLDLPGLVRSQAMDESPTLPQDIQQLVDAHLANPRSIILAVHAASNDFHNSQIMADAMKVDPDTSRTIPVLTKPDLIDPGAEEGVVELLMGEKIDFSLGFHMVKGLGQAAREQECSIQDGINDETRFFQTQEPWKSIRDRTCFGTAQLRRKLGELQMTMIRDSLPGIATEVHNRHLRARNKLQEIGEIHVTMSDRRRFYQDLCQSLVSKLQSGRSTKQNLAASLHESCAVFMRAVREGSLATIRTVVEGAQVMVASPRGSVRGEVVHLDETFACVDFVEEQDSSSDVLFDEVGVKATEPIEENDVWSDGTKVFIARKDGLYDTLRKIPLPSIRTDPSWLKKKISENRAHELACFVDTNVFKNLIESFIEEDWRPHCDKLLEDTEAIVLTSVEEAIKETLSKQRYPSLKTLIERQCRKAAQTLLLAARKHVNAHLEHEKHPYTQDSLLFENIAEARHRSLRRELEVSLRLDQEGVYDTQAIKVIIDGVFERDQQKCVEDHMAEEMEVVLESYGQIATRRVIDRTPMICWEAMRSLSGAVQDALWEVTDDTLSLHMQEFSSFAEEYQAAQAELAAMDRAVTALEALSTLQ